jgi:hypothetical protein
LGRLGSVSEKYIMTSIGCEVAVRLCKVYDSILLWVGLYKVEGF